MEELKKAEASVIYRNVNMRPKLLERDSLELRFELENVGNTDVDLLFVDADSCRIASYQLDSAFLREPTNG